MKKFFQVPMHGLPPSLALLFLRLVVGSAFLFHGWGKIQNPMGWMGPDATVPGFFQLLAAVSEFGGGIALILGLFTPLACLGIICTMVVAVHFHMNIFKDPFVNMTGTGGSYELPLVYLSVALVIFGLGPGRFSSDRKVFGGRSPSLK